MWGKFDHRTAMRKKPERIKRHRQGDQTNNHWMEQHRLGPLYALGLRVNKRLAGQKINRAWFPKSRH